MTKNFNTSHFNVIGIMSEYPPDRNGYTSKRIQEEYKKQFGKLLKISTIYKILSDLYLSNQIMKFKNENRIVFYCIKGIVECTPQVEIEKPAKSFISWIINKIWEKK